MSNSMSVGTLLFAVILICAATYDRKKFRKKYEDLRSHYISIITALASAIDTRDSSALGHTERVMNLSKKVALELNNRGYKIDLDSLELAALLHDVGKIGVPDSVLRKPGPPTKEEWDQIKKHPDIGANILEPLYELRHIKEAIKYHQEHYDGLGYPKGLKAKDIPLMSRIIMIVDTYDAITSDRAYRPRRSKDEAIKEIKTHTGTQFDPEIADVFVKIAKENYAGK